jgi:hypothetical protein
MRLHVWLSRFAHRALAPAFAEAQPQSWRATAKCRRAFLDPLTAILGVLIAQNPGEDFR